MWSKNKEQWTLLEYQKSCNKSSLAARPLLSAAWQSFILQHPSILLHCHPKDTGLQSHISLNASRRLLRANNRSPTNWPLPSTHKVSFVTEMPTEREYK